VTEPKWKQEERKRKIEAGELCPMCKYEMDEYTRYAWCVGKGKLVYYCGPCFDKVRHSEPIRPYRPRNKKGQFKCLEKKERGSESASLVEEDL
jgi:hypothetical protein